MAENCSRRCAEVKRNGQASSIPAPAGTVIRRFCCKKRTPSSLVQLAFVFALTLGLCGCEPVQSLYPFCDPKDAFFDAALLGSWVNKEETGLNTIIRFEKDSLNPNNYKAEILFRTDKPEEDKPDQGTISFRVQLFQIGQSQFADFYPLHYSAKSGKSSLDFDSKDNPFGIPTHTVYKVKLEKEHLVLAWLDDDYVKRFEAKSKLSLGTPNLDHYLLTAETENLKTNLLINADKENLIDSEGIAFERQP